MQELKFNFCLMTDGYKLQHFRQYVPNTQVNYEYFESRTGAQFNKTVVFGMQYLLKNYFEGPVVTQDMIEEADAFNGSYFGGVGEFNRPMWQHIVDKYGGYLPIKIRAVPEGSPVEVSNVLFDIENTDDLCAPLVGHCETVLSNMWGPSTTATLSREVKILCNSYLTDTSDTKAGLNFMLHDFGMRGVGEPHVAALHGAGHLLNFLGTDTLSAMQLAHQYYGADYKTLAYSVPATEHSVMTARGEAGEKQIFADNIKQFPNGILSIVIDSYDYRRFIRTYALELKNEILARNGKTVFRPDSGEPITTTLDVLDHLNHVFGSTLNSKGYRVLNPKVGVLWGDGIDYKGKRDILFAMKNMGWSAENIVFGAGGALLQRINRDTQRCAMKSAAQMRDNVWHDIQKRPIDASKKSKTGKLKLIKENGIYHTVKQGERPELPDELVTVFENGRMVKEWTFDECRQRAKID